MVSRLSNLPTTYLVCAFLALVAIGYAINAIKPVGSTGLIVAGVCQIIVGLCMLTLAYAYIRKRWY